MPVLFAFTLFLSATLLFMVQPMVGKMVLPLLGGGAGVWNTCMVFFQALLLLGYLYAHKLSGITDVKKQVRIHLGVLAATASLMVLSMLIRDDHSPVPVLKSLAPQGSAFPFFNVLGILAVAIGIPFFTVSTSAPLLQRWFTATAHPSARDPYFLYAASNAGSLISLLGYPLVTEPTLRLLQQAWLWGAGFLLLIGFTLQCGRGAMNPLRPIGSSNSPSKPGPAASSDEIPWSRKLKWIGWAFVPSSLMLGVTTHMTTDIASVPLLWVIPLALYLLTFIIAFAKTPAWFRPILANISPVTTLILVFVITSAVSGLSTFVQLMLHLVVYFLAALLMHSELARDRPDPKHLTGYFLLMSVGGVLGGLFNAIVAPLAFPYTYEYPIAIVVGCLLIPALISTTAKDHQAQEKPEEEARAGLRIVLDFVVPMLMLTFVATLYWAASTETFNEMCRVITRGVGRALVFAGLSGLDWRTVAQFVAFAPPCMACFLFIDRPVRFGLCVAAVLFMHYYTLSRSESIRVSSRSFYGILKVEEYEDDQRIEYMPKIERTEFDKDGKPIVYTIEPGYKVYAQTRSLLHGTTLHGRQFTESFRVPVGKNEETGELIEVTTPVAPLLRDEIRLFGCATGWETLALAGARQAWDPRQDPLTYYHRTGPIGDLFRESFRRTSEKFRRVPTVGMVGLGTGSVSCYAVEGMSMTYYEIDRSVIDLVEKPTHLMNEKAVKKKGAKPEYGPFTYVEDARKRGAKIDFVLGDARLKLDENTNPKYDLLLIDAFSSDSIPIHLLTEESVRLYEKRLAENGLLALHISNRYIQLEPVVAAIAKKVGLACRIFSDSNEGMPGKTASSWVVLTRSEAELEPAFTDPTPTEPLLGGTPRATWVPLDSHPDVPSWTDDHADVLRVIKLKEVQTLRKMLGFPTPVRD